MSLHLLSQVYRYAPSWLPKACRDPATGYGRIRLWSALWLTAGSWTPGTPCFLLYLLAGGPCDGSCLSAWGCAGLTDVQAAEVATALSALPTVSIADVTCKVRRPPHRLCRPRNAA